MAYSWPGNVRELKNTIESMVVIDTDGLLDLDDLTEDLQAIVDRRPGRTVRPAPISLVGKSLEEIEKHYIIETLKLTSGNREEAARILGIGERTLYRKLKEYGAGDETNPSSGTLENRELRTRRARRPIARSGIVPKDLFLGFLSLKLDKVMPGAS